MVFVLALEEEPRVWLVEHRRRQWEGSTRHHDRHCSLVAVVVVAAAAVVVAKEPELPLHQWEDRNGWEYTLRDDGIPYVDVEEHA